MLLLMTKKIAKPINMNQQISELTNHYQLLTIGRWRCCRGSRVLQWMIVRQSQRSTELQQKHTDVTTQFHVRRVKEGNLINALVASMFVTQCDTTSVNLSFLWIECSDTSTQCSKTKFALALLHMMLTSNVVCGSLNTRTGVFDYLLMSLFEYCFTSCTPEQVLFLTTSSPQLVLLAPW